MNAFSMAQRAYAPTSAPTRTARSAEYDVIARITFRMKSALEGNHFPKLAEALHENRVLWTALASDVAGEANQLPAELRARIFYLAEFTLLHTSKVLAKQASAVPLLDINAAILRGLRQAEVAK